MEKKGQKKFDLSLLGQQTDFRGFQFEGLDLSQIDFSGCDFEMADFTNANLREANFSNSNVSLATFKGADLRGAKFEGVRLISESCDVTEEWIGNYSEEFIQFAVDDFEVTEAEWEDELQDSVWDHEDSIEDDDDFEYDDDYEEGDDDDGISDEIFQLDALASTTQREYEIEMGDEVVPNHLPLTAREQAEDEQIGKHLDSYEFLWGDTSFRLTDFVDQSFEYQDQKSGTSSTPRSWLEDRRLDIYLESAFRTIFLGPFAANFSGSIWDETTIWPAARTIRDYPWTHSPPGLIWSDAGIDSNIH